MNDVLTLKSLASLAIEHEVDFEVIHGETTHKDKRVRAQMVLSPANCPEVRVLFGDAKHGQRLSSISLASNPKVLVKKEHLLAAVAENSTNAGWRRTMTRETPLFNINTTENNMISISANVIKKMWTEITDTDGEKETLDHYEAVVSNHVADARTLSVFSPEPELIEVESTVFYVKVDPEEHPEFKEQWENSVRELELVGEYIFPNTLKFHRFK
jgi:hypothetical protein